MGLERIDTSPLNYVVLDVETNGLESQRCDLLSISLYRPELEGESAFAHSANPSRR